MVASIKKTYYKFAAKERDEETGYDYFGARYYDSDLSQWLSVDPMSDKRPNISPYNYCQWNPVGRTDPNGALDGWVEDPANPNAGV
ncbi:MAG: RHS repeat-associated core domain-containing protein, partial [Ignavibacteria bacterium]|nr:RHS repeat-associated core domain-containing protein [Ignavibacteria bacterium]